MAFSILSQSVCLTYYQEKRVSNNHSFSKNLICCSSFKEKEGRHSGETGGLFGISGVEEAYPLCLGGIKKISHRGAGNEGIVTTAPQVAGGGDPLFSSAPAHRLIRTLHAGSNNLVPPSGSVGIAICTPGQSICSQPVIGGENSVAIGFVGKILNFLELSEKLKKVNDEVETLSDSELLLKLFLHSRIPLLERRILSVCESIRGGFSFLMIAEGSLIAARDPQGLFPLVMGRSTKGNALIVGSEDVSFRGYRGIGEYIRDILPGELVIVRNGKVESFQLLPKAARKSCFLETRMSHPRTVTVFGDSLIHHRERLGKLVARISPVEADCTLAFTESSYLIASGYAQATGTRFTGFVFPRNPLEIPEDQIHDSILRHSLIFRDSLPGKKVVLFDDTMTVTKCAKAITRVIKTSGGAKELHVRVGWPPLEFSCPYGVDLKKYKVHPEFNLSGSLEYDSYADLPAHDLLRLFKSEETEDFCFGCLTGVFPIVPGSQGQE